VACAFRRKIRFGIVQIHEHKRACLSLNPCEVSEGSTHRPYGSLEAAVETARTGYKRVHKFRLRGVQGVHSLYEEDAD
jgi:hypothetical protein